MYSSSHSLNIQFHKEWQATMATSTLTADGGMGGWEQTLVVENVCRLERFFPR